MLAIRPWLASIVTVPVAGISFPKFYVFASAANGVIDVVPAATAVATGTVNPATGKATFHVSWKLEVIQSFFKIDCASSISMDLSSDPTDPANAGPIGVAPVPYNASTGTVTVSGNMFALGAETVCSDFRLIGVFKFERQANAAKAGCPISRLLNAKITMNARLA